MEKENEVMESNVNEFEFGWETQHPDMVDRLTLFSVEQNGMTNYYIMGQMSLEELMQRFKEAEHPFVDVGYANIGSAYYAELEQSDKVSLSVKADMDNGIFEVYEINGIQEENRLFGVNTRLWETGFEELKTFARFQASEYPISHLQAWGSFAIWSDADAGELPSEFVLYNPLLEKYYHVIPSKDVMEVSDTIRMAEQYMSKEQIERFDSVRLGLSDNYREQALGLMEKYGFETYNRDNPQIDDLKLPNSMSSAAFAIVNVKEDYALFFNEWKEVKSYFEEIDKLVEDKSLEQLQNLREQNFGSEDSLQFKLAMDAHRLVREKGEEKAELPFPDIETEKGNEEYYKIFYDGEESKDAEEFQKEKGWNKVYLIGGKQGVTFDSLVVYRSVEDLPKNMQEHIRQLEIERFDSVRLGLFQPGKDVERGKEFKEITLKFGKGCVGDEFKGRDGTAYRQILVPNVDKNDSRPWQTFVVKANHVHEDKFGKGVWIKLPADGHTTLKRTAAVGEKPDGKKEWGTEQTKVSNVDLKKMMESYKEKSKPSLTGKLADKNNKAKQENAGKQQDKDIKEKSTKKDLS